MTVMPAWAAPPRFSSKNSVCTFLGLPRVIVQATIRPSRGATKSLRLAPTRSWNAVVRDTTSHGLPRQLGFTVALAPPTSMIVAPAEAGSAQSAASATRTSRFAFMPAFNTSGRPMLPCDSELADVDGLGPLVAVLLLVGHLRTFGER